MTPVGSPNERIQAMEREATYFMSGGELHRCVTYANGNLEAHCLGNPETAFRTLASDYYCLLYHCDFLSADAPPDVWQVSVDGAAPIEIACQDLVLGRNTRVLFTMEGKVYRLPTRPEIQQYRRRMDVVKKRGLEERLAAAIGVAEMKQDRRLYERLDEWFWSLRSGLYEIECQCRREFSVSSDIAV